MYDQILSIVRQAGEKILQASGDKGVTEKTSRHDLVTRYDKAVQEFLREALLAAMPEAGFLGEEDEGQPVCTQSCRFIVDPIDGTTNFVKDFRFSCVSVALERAGEIVFGAVYNPYSDELFSAETGKGAYLNNAPIAVSDCDMAHGLAFAGMSPYNPERMDLTFRLTRRLAESCLDIRRTGSAALEMCYVAAGRADLFFEARLSPWDYAAASLILAEAGGRTSDLAGKPLQFTGKTSVAAGNALCHPALLRLAEEVTG